MWRGAGGTSSAHSSGQRLLRAIHLWFQDSQAADRFGSPGAGLWAVTTDTQTNQELSLKPYQLDKVTGVEKQGTETPRACVRARTCASVCVCVYDREKDIKSRSYRCTWVPLSIIRHVRATYNIKVDEKKERRQTDMLIIATSWIPQPSLTSIFFSNKGRRHSKTKRMIMYNITASTDS